MKKLNRKLKELAAIGQNGGVENFVNSLEPQEVGNLLNLIKVRQRQVESEGFNKISKLMEKIREEERMENNCSKLNLRFLKDDLRELILKKDAEIEFWKKLEKLFSDKKLENQKKKKERMQKQ